MTRDAVRFISMRPACIIVLMGAWLLPVEAVVLAADYFVAPNGNDAWDGSEASPFATVDRAQQVVRTRIAAGLTADLTVLIRGGTYRITAPIVFGTSDSPPIGRSVTYAAYPGERPILSGGRRITGWSANANGTWSVLVPQVVSEAWHFRELFVNGRRRERARHPNTGFLRVLGPDPAGGSNNRTSFVYAPGDLPPGSNFAGAELTFMHDWCISRVRIAQVNRVTRVLTVSQPIGAVGLINSVFQTEEHPRFAIENDASLLDAPGEWHLETTTGLLTYRPMPGEFMQTAEVVAPKATELLVVRGNLNTGAPARQLHFFGLTFEHCAWGLPTGGFAEYQAGYYEWRDTSTPYTLPAALTFEVTDSCSFEGGRVAHCGGWGVMFGMWCRNGRFAGNVVEDIAGNGILIGEDRYRNVPGGSWWTVRPDQVAAYNVVESNWVQDCGRTLYGCVGIWSGLTDTTFITNNVIRRLPQSGISAGALWSDVASPCRATRISGNEIHDVMQLLSDGAAIYTVGLSPGSRIYSNRIHDIPPNVGVSDSSGMFFDQGSTGFSVSDNGIFNVAKAPFRFHATGANEVIDNTLQLMSTATPAIRFQNMSASLVQFSGNRIYSPSSPHNCHDPVCERALDAGIASAYTDWVLFDGDGDGLADVDDPCPTRIPGDANGDGTVNGDDLHSFVQVLMEASFSSEAYCAAEMTGDGLVGPDDVAMFVNRLIAN